MPTPIYSVLDHDIVCIDALYTAPKVACLYLIKDSEEYAFIETGTNNSVPNINAVLAELNIEPEQVRYVIPTHVHLDHAGAAGTLLTMYPNAELLIHPRGARHMIDPSRLIESSIAVYGKSLFNELYGVIVPAPANRVRTVEDEEDILVGSRKLSFKYLRGHADHHFCIFDTRSQGWFSGDMFGFSYPTMRLGATGLVVPATTPTQFEPDLYIQSVNSLAGYNPRSMYLTHFGAIEFSPRHVEQLTRQLDAYAAFGREFDGDLALIEQSIREG